VLNNFRIPTKPRQIGLGMSGWRCLLAIQLLCLPGLATAAEPIKTGLVQKDYAIAPGSLSDALPSYAAEAGVLLGFDPLLTRNKQTQGLKGHYSIEQGFSILLQGSGLEVIEEAAGKYKLQRATPKNDDAKTLPEMGGQGGVLKLKEIEVRARRLQDVGPMPGLALTKDQIAGNLQSISAKEIKEANSISLAELLNSKLQSINVNDYQGNPFQMDISYRGFTAGPQIGTPQGLSVFFDGIRVNEAFGDVVNWDMIPMNALSSFDVYPGSNPLFGLNTLGGALSMRTKSGFEFPGVSANVLTGSYGRKQFQGSAGWNNGSIAAFGAVNLFLEDGWRDNSPSKVNQAFGKLEWQGDRLGITLSSLAVVNKLVGNGTVPQELYRQDPASVFTSPDETKNTLFQMQLSSVFDITDQISLTGQVYHRSSKRNSTTGDIIDQETFSNADKTYHMWGTRLPGEGNGLQCAYTDSDRDGVPDYYVVTEANYTEFLTKLGNGITDYSLLELNGALPTQLTDNLKASLNKGVWDVFVNDDSQVYIQGFMKFGEGLFFTDDNGNSKVAFAAPAANATTCRSGPNGWNQGMIGSLPYNDRDGAVNNGTGVVKGTPTAILTNSNIQQTSQGMNLQLNFNFDKHKFMVGAALDTAKSSYLGKSRLALMDDQRNVYSDPSQLGEEFYAASHDLTINDFFGDSSTRSLYFSETWSPTQNLHITGSGRYNTTRIKNTLAPTKAERRLEDLFYLNRYVYGLICPGTDLSECPYSVNGPIDSMEYWNNLVMPGIREQLGLNGSLLDRYATEKFSYYSFNPSLGITWQTKPNLNLYANWNQGSRAPSVVELGCAWDGTLVGSGNNMVPRSLAEGRGCKLPSALSGDPYLPQVKAQTIEAGARGRFKDFLEWNVSAYRTDLRNDIYLVSATSELSFFQDIGDTRRQGIEFGLSAEYGRSDFRVNYSLTEATFQSYFKMVSANNSSRTIDTYSTDYNMIQVKPGNVMPGIPFNNINFNWGYKVTPDFKINFNLVAHSGSFLRGNENNAHTPSQGRQVSYGNVVTTLPDNDYSGTAPGYAVVNFNARYNLGNGWSVRALINNLLDKQYYTAGRLGISPFAPSTIGAIGPGGFNYNSSEWVPTQFISAGAPRGIWFSLNYDFDASRKYEPPPSNLSMTDPDRTLETPSTLPNQAEMTLMRQLDDIKAVPVLQSARGSVEKAKQQVTQALQQWQQAIAGQDFERYLERYAPSYAPPGRSRNQWVEQQKMAFIASSMKNVEMRDLVIAPQGMRMVAVFSWLQVREGMQYRERKVISWEQRDGEWRIVRENAVPMGRQPLADTQQPGAVTLKQPALAAASNRSAKGEY
jgi:outer membrane receptor protein involved in Fe transport